VGLAGGRGGRIKKRRALSDPPFFFVAFVVEKSFVPFVFRSSI
jgi:hypothetical protein